MPPRRRSWSRSRTPSESDPMLTEKGVGPGPPLRVPVDPHPLHLEPGILGDGTDRFRLQIGVPAPVPVAPVSALLERREEDAVIPQRPADQDQDVPQLRTCKMEERRACPHTVELVLVVQALERQQPDRFTDDRLSRTAHALGAVHGDNQEALFPESHRIPSGAASEVQYPGPRPQQGCEGPPGSRYVPMDCGFRVPLRIGVVECYRGLVHGRSSRHPMNNLRDRTLRKQRIG